MPLAGGIMQYGYQCGMIWGAALAAGAEAHKRFGAGPKAEAAAIVASRKVVESFRALAKHINCLEITDIDRSATAWKMIKFFLIKGGTIHCFRMASKFSPTAYRAIEAGLAEAPDDAPAPPVSCAAEVARKMGASDLQVTMAAGFAGGIGLCGGACGALGAAIWMISLKDGKADFKNPRAQQAIERFLKSADHEFECAKIVGRNFESVADHSDYIRGGGCAAIIGALTADGG